MRHNRPGIRGLGPDGCPEFTERGLIVILNEIKGKTFGEVDIGHVFENDRGHKGIAGAVIERSVLKYPANNEQRHDILIDGRPTEVKTTGLREKGKLYVAKEPVTITAVGLENISKEKFEQSHFWDKAAQILFIFYLYKSAAKVEYKEYARFPILDYLIYTPNPQVKEIMKADWECIRQFIVMIQREYDDPKQEYPRLSYELRENLVVLDTAPKYPRSPRFRFKRSYVDYIVQTHFNMRKLEHLSLEFNRYTELDNECERLTTLYGGRAIGDISAEFGIFNITKNASEQVLVRMFGGKSKKLSRIEQFTECSVICKSVVMTYKEKYTECCKLYTVDFDEMLDPNISDFSDSYLYEYLVNHQFLIALFQEPYDKCDFSENQFLGFKRISLPDDALEHARKCWSDLRDTVFSKQLTEKIVRNKDGKPITNKCGTIRTSVNFPKAKDHMIFLRGTSSNSARKTVVVEDIKVYPTQIWIKGQYLLDIIKERY